MAFWGWLAGRKTYILAGALILAVLTLVSVGRLTPETAAVLVTFSVSGFAATFRSALQRHQAEEIAILRGIAQAGAALAAHNAAGALGAAGAVGTQAVQLAAEVSAERGV